MKDKQPYENEHMAFEHHRVYKKDGKTHITKQT